MGGFEYLNSEKRKQNKIMNIPNEKLEMQEYLLSGDRNIKISKLIFKARGSTLDIKTQKKWKYSDKLCSGCEVKDETGDEILNCKTFGENEENVSYSWFFRDCVKDQILVAKLMMTKLDMRRKIREEIT